MKERRSLKYLIVSACLALLLVSVGGIMAGASETVETDPTLNIWKSSLSLEDKVSIAFAVEESLIDPDGDGLDYSVYTYTTNPTGTAEVGTKLTRVQRNLNIGGTNYAVFYTEGFAPVYYGETVYARVANPEAGKFGTVKKISVIELVKGLQGNLDPTSERYEIKKGLYETLLNYGTTAQKVLGDTYPVYNYFTVDGGQYVDAEGGTWSSGVAVTGDTVELVADARIPFVWGDGTNEYAGNEVTVTANDTVFTPYYDMSRTETNYYSSTWTGTTNTYYQFDQLFTSGSMLASSEATKGATLNFKNNALELSYPYKTYTAKTEAQTGASDMGNNSTMMFSNSYSHTNSSNIISFTLSYEADLNGNGTPYEYGPVAYTVTEQVLENGLPVDKDEDGAYDTETKTLYMSGDFFRGGTNAQIARIPVVVGTEATKVKETLMYVNLEAVSSNGIVTGFKVGTSNGTSADTNKTYEAKEYDIKVPHNFAIEIVNDEVGAVTAIKTYVDGELVRTNLVSNGKNALGWNYEPTTQIYTAGDSKHSWYGIQYAQPGRTLATAKISNLTSTTTNMVPYSELAAYGYNTDAANYSEAVSIVSYDTTGASQIHAWNTLTAGTAYGLANNYADPTNGNGNMTYDASTNSVSYFKKQGTTASVGGATFLIPNPLYNMKDSWNGEAAVFEFTFTMNSADMNGDGAFDNGSDTINSFTKTSVWGNMLLGYGDGTGGVEAGSFDKTGTTRVITGITESNAVLGTCRVVKTNPGQNTEDYTGNVWSLQYWNATVDNGTAIVPTRNHGVTATLRIVVTPDENGVPYKMSFYCNGEYIETRYNVQSTGKGIGFTYDGYTDTAKGAQADFFAAQYLELTQWFMGSRIGHSQFWGFKSWTQTDLH